MARFATFTVGSPFITLPKALKFDAPQYPANNYIDKLVADKLMKLRITPSELCSDEAFIRRVYVDVIGLLPTVEEYERFMNATQPNKRELLVDELINRKEFVELWVMKWAELLQIRSSNAVSYKSTLLYHNWLTDKIARNVPVNEWVQELLGASGGVFKNPPTNYYQGETDILKVTENVAQVFMGMRIQCAQCHNHPFDRWTMGRLLQLQRLLPPDRPQDRRRPARDHHLQRRRWRGEPPSRRPGDAAEVPRRGGSRRGR